MTPTDHETEGNMASRDGVTATSVRAAPSLPAGSADPVAESGHITPRMSWPRPATSTTLRPNWAGEFRDHADWVNFATSRLTGTYDPLMGNEVPAICVDALGRRCTAGSHFRRAEEEGAFPVRFFWDCSYPAESDATSPSAASAGNPATDHVVLSPTTAGSAEGVKLDREQMLVMALHVARAHIMTLYTSIARGDEEAGARFASGEPAFQQIDAILALASPAPTQTGEDQ